MIRVLHISCNIMGNNILNTLHSEISINSWTVVIDLSSGLKGYSYTTWLIVDKYQSQP